MNIEQQYIDAATAHGANTKSGDYRSTNKAADKLMVLRDELYAQPDHGGEILTRLIANPNKDVARWAASHLLPINEAVAVAVLEQMVADNDGIGSFDAKMVLQQWRSKPKQILN